jgi:hypothetical protein
MTGAQEPRESRPPVVVRESGGFRARQLAGEPVIDGRAWIAVEIISGDVARVVRANDRTFTLRFREAGTDTGDFERYQLDLHGDGRAPVRIDGHLTAWAYITPDSRYVFTEPLLVLDVRAWKQYPLFDILGIRNYTSIDAISRDGRRLLVSRRDCAVDCGEERREYYELTFPQ